MCDLLRLSRCTCGLVWGSMRLVWSVLPAWKDSSKRMAKIVSNFFSPSALPRLRRNVWKQMRHTTERRKKHRDDRTLVAVIVGVCVVVWKVVLAVVGCAGG